MPAGVEIRFGGDKSEDSLVHPLVRKAILDFFEGEVGPNIKVKNYDRDGR